MPAITDIAVCLRRWDFSETSQTVCLFTREHGVVRGLAKGAKRPRSAFSGGLDVLTRGNVVALVKPGRELATITEWHLEETWRFLRHDLQANRAGLYMIDLVYHMVTDHDPHPGLFDRLNASLDDLGRPGRTDAALLELQWGLLEETGYQPALDRDIETGGALPDAAETLVFSPRAGGLLADDGRADGWRVRTETVEVLRRVAAGTEGDPGALDDADAVRRAARLLAAYGREIVGSDLPTMRWTFPDLAPPTDIPRRSG